jgi:AcrR family transcriptional regulator
MKHRLDRRVRRTRKALQKALLSLIVEQNYDTVTVEEIAERADVGRTTFYLHYKDKDALLLEVTGEFADELEETLSAQLERAEICVEDLVGLIFNLAEQHADMYWAIMTGRCGARVLEQFQGVFVPLFKQVLHTQEGEGTDLSVEFTAVYLWGALKETIIWWQAQDVSNGADNMVQRFNRLSDYGLRGAEFV